MPPECATCGRATYSVNHPVWVALPSTMLRNAHPWIGRLRMQEDPVYFGSRRSLAGIVTLVPGRLGGGPNPFVILLNSGRVHRVGPNRMYVGLARTLAAKGFAVLRFDFSGIGDSCDDSTGRRFHEWARQDVQEAIDYLQGAYGAERCILFGICSGAQVGFAIPAFGALQYRIVILKLKILAEQFRVLQRVAELIGRLKILQEFADGRGVRPQRRAAAAQRRSKRIGAAGPREAREQSADQRTNDLRSLHVLCSSVRKSLQR